MSNWEIFKRVVWQRSGGYWLFYTGAIYLAVVMYNEFIDSFTSIELIQVVWLTVTALPLIIKPLASWLNMKTFWEI